MVRSVILIEWYGNEETGLTYKRESDQDVECSVSGSVLQTVTEQSNIRQIVL